MRLFTLKLLCVLSCALSACSGAARPAPEYLDAQTGATVAHVRAPIIFARAHADVAANARQYSNLVVVRINRSGRYEYLLLVYNWTTVDPRLGAGRRPGDTLLLLADERLIRLPRDSRSLHEAGLERPPLRPLHYRGPPWLYVVSEDELQFIADARRLRLQFDADPDKRPFDIWQDGRRALAGLVAGAN
ncbi:MAG: hypothetical protein JOZ93_00300 [Sinobacteraceae bacterium]|nr:hypothetical protein [Nevskiaceae bacterium]MBV9910978.1 hypothetical protein [Nevskiaceae bacterium]